MRRRKAGWVGWLLLLALALAQPSPNTPPPDFSPEVFEIARELRCPVCQGESAAESNAGIAVEMRRIIAEQLAQGKSRAEIREFFVQRYGDWILYEPPARGLTLWVWLSPLVGLGLLGFGLWRYLAGVRARAQLTASDVSEEEIARLEAELQPRERQP
ncbi:cytochrome c-type biogenesis protein CcmH [Meiothermus ruber]|uniref:Cytochrome c-type biogenesis protein n=1 Tax=Meiothermus ruber (strain ATCC 35948 / DSM 1279 / VKM B-1258 / 21) TaxID=504728 RepID=A0A806CQG1_MEIRD|nr:cytochrome c-type biogenesis protein CcmH [Meiothermus ruber]ADD27607.1 cytochrome C biogenesis protein [Meiothermus ruber DSM 1279]MCL6531121.1 cytochrome c-type biogenesis protein CcmH [Meiothermus ruber]